MNGERLRIRGLVQGVGFRPTVWRLARALGLSGRVWNDAAGVVVELWGTRAARDAFVRELSRQAPPLARVDAVERCPLAGVSPEGFHIVPSRGGKVATGVPADAATCPDCLREVMDPADRRYRYPFTNCTHCGPRLSIVRAIPYDRANTSMDAFPMCPSCLAEYEDPADRRFHAQPNACPECGPRLWLEAPAGQVVDGVDPLEEAVARLLAGRILAIKGVGGIHLACRADDENAVAELRRRKGRDHKPFALMARDLEQVARYTVLDERAVQALSGRAAPIVVLPASGEPLAPSVAPGQTTLGFMLPYSPLHHLLMAALPVPLVMTSGNRSEQPQCVDNEEARRRLGGVADALLLHDREILTRLDDSVARPMAGRVRLLRRARGYAPEPLTLHPDLAGGPPTLAMGGALKSTFCLLEDGEAVLSQHLGDLEEAETWQEYQRMLDRYRRLYRFTPRRVAVDLHPDYLSTQLGRRLAESLSVPLIEVQHHHAHILACVAEHGRDPREPVLGVALDGLGMGGDGTLWGGEFLLVEGARFLRLVAFDPVPMPGGVQAVREPWRNTFAHLERALGWEKVRRDHPDLELVRWMEEQPLGLMRAMVHQGVNAPPASSAGRLFDAVAAALGLWRARAPYEGAGAMALESLAASATSTQGYPVAFADDRIHWKPMWRALLADLADGVSPSRIAARFHRGLADAVVETASELHAIHRPAAVALGGGVFQNKLLLEAVTEGLGSRGIQVLVPERVPMNDGGLALGQAVAAACADARD